MSGFQGFGAMDLEKPEFPEGRKTGLCASSSCSICLELVIDQGERSIAKLYCGHEFHLDCIGSAFNAKGAMQCPNCRKVEKGRWLYANGHRSSADFDPDVLMPEEFYDPVYSEMHFGFQWCPIRGFAQLASLLEEGESQPSSYHEPVGGSAFGDHQSASSSTHWCPYLALHGFPHAMHATGPSSSADSVQESGPFPQHPTSLGGGQSSGDVINSHNFPATESQSHNWQQQSSLPFLGAVDPPASQFGPRLSRNDSSSQQRLGSFARPHPLVHGSVTRSGSSNLGAPSGPPVMGGEVRGHSHTRAHGGGHIFQQSVPSSSLRSASFAPVRRSRPRALAFISSIAATSSSAEIGGFYGFTSISGSANRTHQDAESAGRHFDRFYGWGREGFTPLPWIPLEGESQWWGPFNPNQTPQPGGSFLPRANAGERATQSRPETSFQRMPLPPRMPPPSFM